MSLVSARASDLVSCPSCGSTKVTSLTMTLTDGSLVDFTSCHRCEHKSWRQDGRELDRETVLAKTKKHKKA